MRELRTLVAAQLASTTDPAVERAVLGTTDAEEITVAFVTWVRAHLGEPVRAWLWAVSVGVVAGFDLADGRRVVVKAHGPDRSDAHRLRET